MEFSFSVPQDWLTLNSFLSPYGHCYFIWDGSPSSYELSCSILIVFLFSKKLEFSLGRFLGLVLVRSFELKVPSYFWNIL